MAVTHKIALWTKEMSQTAYRLINIFVHIRNPGSL